jgi:hypothetical protein
MGEAPDAVPLARGPGSDPYVAVLQGFGVTDVDAVLFATLGIVLVGLFVLLRRTMSADATAEDGDDVTAEDGADRTGRNGVGVWNRWSLVGLLRAALVTLGLASVALALVVLFRPGLLPLERLGLPSVTPAFRDQALQLLGAVAVSGGLAVYFGRHVLDLGRSTAGDNATDPIPYPPEQVRTPPAERAGTALDKRLSRLGDSGSEYDERQLAAALEETAVALLDTVGGLDEPTATERIETGQWTDDPRAAAFLGDDRAPTPHWRMELWDWLRPTPRSERRVRHTVAALEAYAEDQRGELDDTTGGAGGGSEAVGDRSSDGDRTGDGGEASATGGSDG